MIPRFQPALDRNEIVAALRPGQFEVEQFEERFSSKFGCTTGVAFSYGRAALKAFLESVGLRGCEVIVPAYTCSVVAHAITLSGNIPHFVDSELRTYNMDIWELGKAINERTGAVIVTHIFGYAMDVDAVEDIVASAEKRFQKKIWIVQDCAHAFGATWANQAVTQRRDVALFGLNVSKLITSVFGGMLITSAGSVAQGVRRWRDENSRHTKPHEIAYILTYLMAASFAFRPRWYSALHFLQHRTKILKRLTDAYHLDDRISFPPDASRCMSRLEARVGLVQLEKYDRLISERKIMAEYWNQYLALSEPDYIRPPIVAGATYSHYVVRVKDRSATVKLWGSRGVELGQLIQYSVAAIKAYVKCPGSNSCPRALEASRTTVNFPLSTRLVRKAAAECS